MFIALSQLVRTGFTAAMKTDRAVGSWVCDHQRHDLPHPTPAGLCYCSYLLLQLANGLAQTPQLTPKKRLVTVSLRARTRV